MKLYLVGLEWARNRRSHKKLYRNTYSVASPSQLPQTLAQYVFKWFNP